MKNKAIIISLIILITAVIGWWLASPLFINKVVDEQLPGTDALDRDAELQGFFADADSFHKTSGIAKVIIINEKKFLSLENFETTNGPDLYVYLARDKEAEDFINLGTLKGNKGNQNYEIPENVDINSYSNVLIWCRAFSVLFGSAKLR